MSIGNNIKKIRELKDIKREYVADQLGLSLSAYGKIERGATKIEADQERTQKIADILGVSKETLENFSEDISIHHVTIGNGSYIRNSKNNNNDNQDELIALHKQTLQLLENVTKILLKISEKETEE